MPSDKPAVLVRLETDLHARVVEAAQEQGRSVSNLIAFELRKVFPSWADRAAAINDAIERAGEIPPERQVDIEDLAPPPARKRKRSAARKRR